MLIIVIIKIEYLRKASGSDLEECLNLHIDIINTQFISVLPVRQKVFLRTLFMPQVVQYFW